MASNDLAVQRPAQLTGPDVAPDDGAGRVPDAIRQRAADMFGDVVDMHGRLATVLGDYLQLAATVQGCADEIDDYDRAIHLEEQVGVRLIFDLLVDMSYQIGDATGWEPEAVDAAVARHPQGAWPATAWPLPAGVRT